MGLVGAGFVAGTAALGFLLAAEVVAATAAVSEAALIYCARHRNMMISLAMIVLEAGLAAGLILLIRDVRGHRAHAEGQGRARAELRPPRVPPGRTRTAPAHERGEGDEQRAQHEVERRVEMRLLRERDRPAEEHEGAREHEQRQRRPGRVAAGRAPAVGSGEEHRLLGEHHRAEGSGEAERDDDPEDLQHGRIVGARLREGRLGPGPGQAKTVASGTPMISRRRVSPPSANSRRSSLAHAERRGRRPAGHRRAARATRRPTAAARAASRGRCSAMRRVARATVSRRNQTP